MSIHNIGDMEECDHEEYRRIYDKHKDNLTVFSSYSGGILGMPEMSTAWGLKGCETALIASKCENWERRREDSEAWAYWKNSDLVAALDREAAHAAEVERLTAERDAAVARAERAEIVVEVSRRVLEDGELDMDANKGMACVGTVLLHELHDAISDLAEIEGK